MRKTRVLKFYYFPVIGRLLFLVGFNTPELGSGGRFIVCVLDPSNMIEDTCTGGMHIPDIFLDLPWRRSEPSAFLR